MKGNKKRKCILTQRIIPECQLPTFWYLKHKNRHHQIFFFQTYKYEAEEMSHVSIVTATVYLVLRSVCSIGLNAQNIWRKARHLRTDVVLLLHIPPLTRVASSISHRICCMFRTDDNNPRGLDFIWSQCAIFSFLWMWCYLIQNHQMLSH